MLAVASSFGFRWRRGFTTTIGRGAVTTRELSPAPRPTSERKFQPTAGSVRDGRFSWHLIATRQDTAADKLRDLFPYKRYPLFAHGHGLRKLTFSPKPVNHRPAQAGDLRSLFKANQFRAFGHIHHSVCAERLTIWNTFGVQSKDYILSRRFHTREA